MNLITCDKKCVHQADGFCNLNTTTFISNSKAGDCCYFKDVKSNDSSSKSKNKKAFR